MPIRFQCSCGRSLTAPDDRAGARARCPGCQKIVQVPKRRPAPAANAPASCPSCGTLNEAGAAKCDHCGAVLRAGSRVISGGRTSIMDHAPFRWIDEYKLWIFLGVIAVVTFILMRALFATGSEAFGTYRQFADLLLQQEYNRAKKMAEGDALEQIESVQWDVGFEWLRQVKVKETRSLYSLISETPSRDGKSVTLRLTQQYWTTVPGSLKHVPGEEAKHEREHTALLVVRDGKWIVASLEIGPERKSGEDAPPGETPREIEFIAIDAAGCGITTGEPLGTYGRMNACITGAGLTKGVTKEERLDWGTEPTQIHTYNYTLPAKKGPGWPESIEVVIDLRLRVQKVTVTFRISTAISEAAEESRVARFAADFWKTVFGEKAKPGGDGKARAGRGSLTGEWRKKTAASKEIVVVSLNEKKDNSEWMETLWSNSDRAHGGRVLDVGFLSISREVITAGEDRMVKAFRRTLDVEELKHPAPVHAAVSGPIGRRLVTG
ncbi:MAG: hypothetical protein ACYTAF_16350, partial [Planctomycetota bacterium]